VFDIGASLAAAREARGYSLADAERLTNVRQKYLSALERGDFDALPGRTYARAFLRTYASALGLEADRFVAAFEDMVPEPEEDTIVVGTPQRRRVVRPSYLAAIVAVAVVVGVAAWGVSSHNASTLGRTPPPAAAATVRSHTTKPAATKKILVRVMHTQPKPAALVIDAARGDCWLQVRSGGANGAVVYEGTLQAGSTMRFAQSSVWVRFGAPANVDAARGGKSVAGLAGSGPVDVVA
jgi:cytoskeleton protein RodZ